MDFEERIQRLTERHEALTQSAELLAIDIREMQESIRGMREFQASTQKSIEGLLRIAERISRLEGGAA